MIFRVPPITIRHLACSGNICRWNALRAIHSQPASSSYEGFLKELRMDSGENSVTPEKFMEFLAEYKAHKENRNFVNTFVNAFQRLLGSLSTAEVMVASHTLLESSIVRRDVQLRKVIRDSIADLPSHGIASFSLESIQDFATLCNRLSIEYDPVFARSMCQRVVSVVPRNSAERVQFLSYLIKLSQSFDHPMLREKLTSSDSEDIRKLPLYDLDALSRMADDSFLERLALDIEFVVQQREVLSLLDELRSVRVDSELFDLVLAKVDIPTEGCTVDCHMAALLLHIWGRKGKIPGPFINVFEDFASAALQSEETDLVAAIAALSRLQSQGISDVLKTQIVTKLVSHEWEFESPQEIENFTSVIECVSLLGITDAALIGCIAQDIDRLMARREPIPNVWKLSTWWHGILHTLPFESVLPSVLVNEYPDTLRALHGLTSNYLVQPVPDRLWNGSIMRDIAQKLVEQHVSHTEYPVIKKTPIRTHFRVQMPSGDTVYVLLARDSNDILRVRRDARVPLNMYKACVYAAGAKLAIVPVSEFDDNNPFTDVIASIKKYLVS